MAKRSLEDEFGGAPLPQILCQEEELPAKETWNLGELSEYVFDLSVTWGSEYQFTPDIVRNCNQFAMGGIYADAGQYRTRFVHVEDFTGAPHWDIPQLVAEMCEYVNVQIHDPFHAAAYTLWRTSWIHPFYDGKAGFPARSVTWH